MGRKVISTIIKGFLEKGDFLSDNWKSVSLNSRSVICTVILIIVLLFACVDVQSLIVDSYQEYRAALSSEVPASGVTGANA